MITKYDPRIVPASFGFSSCATSVGGAATTGSGDGEPVLGGAEDEGVSAPLGLALTGTAGGEGALIGWSVFNNDFVVDDTCTGDACVGLYTDNGVNASNTTIYGNVTDPSRPIPPRPSN